MGKHSSAPAGGEAIPSKKGTFTWHYGTIPSMFWLRIGGNMWVVGEELPVPTSRKQQALDFISDYILRLGRSPAMSEIAGALGVSDTRAKALVKKLAAEQMIERAAGAQRAISVPGLIERHLLERMRGMGMVVNEDFVQPSRVMPLPQGHLPLVAIIEHIPDLN